MQNLANYSCVITNKLSQPYDIEISQQRLYKS